MRGKKDIKNIIGTKYSKLTILEYLGSDSKYRSMVKVVCECGNITKVRLSALKYGSTTSCGCANKEAVKKSATTHGLSKTPLYRVWAGIKSRCLNPKSNAYKHYGGRGIDLYHYWAKDFRNFLYWCIKNGWEKGLEIDRIDNNKGYSPDNCRIVTDAINSRNKRNNHYITIGGKTMVLQDWCKLYDIRHNTALCRLKRGLKGEELFTKKN